VPFRVGPDSFSMHGRLKDLIQQGYEVEDYQVAGAPEWVQTERYDVLAKAASAASPHEIRAMLKALLAERFRLKMHRETKNDDGVCANRGQERGEAAAAERRVRT